MKKEKRKEPETRGSKLAADARAKANKLTRAERDELHKVGIALIRGTDTKSMLAGFRPNLSAWKGIAERLKRNFPPDKCARNP